MSVIAAAAWLYAALALLATLFQLALAFGAPWGHLTLGGRYSGRLPGRIRVAAAGQGALLAFMAVVVLGRAQLVHPAPPGWLFWIVVAITALTAVLNLVSRSIPERRLWGPVTLLMLVSVIRVAID